MQLSIGLRGNLWDVQRVISEIQAKYVLMDFEEKDENGKMQKVKHPVNIVFRPFIIGELVFPETALQTILATIHGKSANYDNFVFNQARKYLGFEKVPDYDGVALPFPIWDKNVEIVPIGIKKDEFGVDKSGSKHELI